MDPEAKKKVLRMIPYGMFVIGVHSATEVNAYTADWVTQSSFDPPLVVICCKKGTISNDMIRTTRVFSVNVLDAGQKEMAAHFVKPMKNVGNKFGHVEYHTEKTGCPILRDSLGFFECDVVDINDAGDHSIVIGKVINAGVHREGEPLLLRSTGWHYGG